MKKALQELTYGQYILTALKKGDELETRQKDYIAAGTINWASQVSFSPPVLAIAVGQKSDLNETINYSGKFTLHLLGTDNREMVSKFSSKSEIEDGKINGFKFSKVNDQALLENTSGIVTCEVEDYKHIGDHFVYFGKVIESDFDESKSELLSTKNLAHKYTEEVASV